MSNVLHISGVSFSHDVWVASENRPPRNLGAYNIRGFGDTGPEFTISVPSASRLGGKLPEYQNRLAGTSWLVRCDLTDTDALIGEILRIITSISYEGWQKLSATNNLGEQHE